MEVVRQLKQVCEQLTAFTPLAVIARIVLAVLLGSLIGWNRGKQGRAAGLRTHALVCLGSALSLLVGLYSTLVLQAGGDPTRIGVQVISGIGFLGVGTILTKRDLQITGLTTAAGLWATAAIGFAVGIGFYLGAILSAALVILTMTCVNRLVKTKNRSGPAVRYYLEARDEAALRLVLSALDPWADDMDIIPAKSGISGHIGLRLSFPYEDVSQIQEHMARLMDDGTAVFFTKLY